MCRQMIVVALFAFICVGCSHTVKVGLRPNFDADLPKENQIVTVKPAASFVQGKFSDKRADTSKLTTFKQGIHTYNLYEERPLDAAFFEGLKALFTHAGHMWADSGAAEVRVDLQMLNFQASRNAGFLMVGASSSVQIKLDFVNAQTGNVIYAEIYSGVDKRDKAMLGLMGMVRKSIDAAIIDGVKNVGNDNALAAALKKFKAGTKDD